MQTINLKIANLSVEITTVFNSVAPLCGDYLSDEAPAFSVRTTEEDILAERRKSIEEHAYEGIPYPDFSPAELESTAVYRKIAEKLPEYDALVFHGSAVGVNGKAYLFTASSGTGKTTHTNLWLRNIEGSFVVNGDKPILRIIDGKVFVCGTPWMGKERLGTNIMLPLSAVCFLNRGAENSIGKVSLSAVLPGLIGQAYRPPNGTLLMKTVRLLEKIGQSVELYELFCNMENEAAEIAYKGMCHD